MSVYQNGMLAGILITLAVEVVLALFYIVLEAIRG